jgi:hypothetical protein
MEKLYGINEKEKLDKLLTYKIGSFQQLKTLLNRNGYQLIENTNDGRSITISKTASYNEVSQQIKLFSAIQ